MSPDETDILVNPEERIIEQVTIEDVKKANDLFNELMGDNVTLRKRFITEHSAEATYQI